MSIVGPTGPQGPQGERGKNGRMGPAGPAGSSGGGSSIINGDNVIGATGTFTNLGTEQNTLFGVSLGATGTGSVTIGYGASTSLDNAIAIGNNTKSNGSQSVAIGPGYQVTGAKTVAIGTTDGGALTVTPSSSIIIGRNISTYGTESNINLGFASQTSNTDSTAIGRDSKAKAQNAIAIGYNTNVTVAGGVAIGNGASSTTTANQIVLGNSSSTVKPGGNLILSSSATDPASAAPGMIYFNTATNKLKFYNGTAWETITSA